MQTKNNKTKSSSAVAQKTEENSTTQPANVVTVSNGNKIVENNLAGKDVEVSNKKSNSRKTTQQATPVAAPAPAPAPAPATATATKGRKTKVVETPVVEEAVVAPVVEEAKQTKGRKTKVAAPVVEEQVVVPEVAPEPTKQTRKTKQKVNAPVAVEAQPVVEVQQVPEAQAPAPTKRTKRTKEAVEQQPEVVEAEAPKVKRARKVKEVKEPKRARKAKAVAVAEGAEGAVAVEGVPVVQVGEEKNMRYFKLIYDNNETHGRYSGKKPKQAANKAFSSIVKEHKANNHNTEVQEHSFSIVECTRNSKCKEYKYIGKRESLPEPVPVYIPHKTELNLQNLNVVSEKSVKDVVIRQKKVDTTYSGKEVTLNTKSVYLVSSSGPVFKKITYRYRNNIQKLPKEEQEVAAA
jgi:hypothetical protein